MFLARRRRSLFSAPSGGGGFVAGPISVPSGFTYTPAYTLTRASDGSISHNYNIDADKFAATTQIYCKPGGLNTADGLSYANAVASLKQAIIRANATGVACTINVDPGTYRYSNTAGSVQASFGAQTPTVDLVIVSSTPGSKVISLCDVLMPAYVATGTDATVYVSTYTTETPAASVIDLAQLDTFGYPKALRRCFPADNTEATVVAAINARVTQYGQGAFYLDTTNKKMYVKRIASAAPDANLVVMSTAGSFNFVLTSSATTRKLWMQDIEMWGCNNGFRVTSGGAQTPAVYLKNCFSGYTATGHTYSWASGGGTAFYVGCVAADSAQDGFNYNGTAGSSATCPTFNEFNCVARWCGWTNDVDSSTNASSCHVNCRGVRVNCTSDKVSNRVYQDIQDAQSWNLGCVAGETRLHGADYSACFVAGLTGFTGTATMWLENCTASALNDYRLQAYASGTIKTANMTVSGFVNFNDGTGTITTYAP